MFASKRKAAAIPAISGKRSLKSIPKKFSFAFVKYFLLTHPLKKYGTNNKLTDFIASMSRSYIPVISATVPPDTPGMMSAAPINRPFKNRRKTSDVFFFDCFRCPPKRGY